MKKIALAALVSAGALFSQDLAGTWQGTLSAANNQPESRIVLKLSKDGSNWKGLTYRIDQGGLALATTVAVTGSTLKLSIPSLGVAYEARLDPDGSTLTGSWTPSIGAPAELKLKHLDVGGVEWPLPEQPAKLKPMAADAHLVFEAASVKPSDPAPPGRSFPAPSRQMNIHGYSLNDLIVWAYIYHANQIAGGPSWLTVDRYDIVATPEAEGRPSPAQWRAMVQDLLATRFQLKFHLEKRELPVYAIQEGKSGHKMTRSADQNADPSIIARRGMVAWRNVTLSSMAYFLQSGVMDHPVVDQTNFEGRWDFQLTWTPDETQYQQSGVPAPPQGDIRPDAPPDIFTAFQEQLGLKLVATKAPIDVMVIEHVEKPTAN
jgi:uncharacterized protein (TIGR03435 family)